MLNYKRKPKVLILQRTIPRYREALFSGLSNLDGYDVSLVVCADARGVKASNSFDHSSIKVKLLKTQSFEILGRRFWRKVGLFRYLWRERPDIIVCEAESHFVALWTAIAYKFIATRKVKLVEWCFFRLPGVDSERSFLHKVFKGSARYAMDHFISYTTFGGQYLRRLGYDDKLISIAVNVCDTQAWSRKFFEIEAAIGQNAGNDGVIRPFRIIYAGTLSIAKRPNIMVELAMRLRDYNCEFLIAGGGELEDELSRRVSKERLQNIQILGHVGDDLGRLIYEADVLLVPGRGGIAISEALCLGCPVITCQADGVELDLIRSEGVGEVTGGDSVTHFEAAILRRMARTESRQVVRSECREVVGEFNTNAMIEAFSEAFRKH